MDVVVRGRNAEVSEVVKATAREKVAKLSRHLDGWEHAEIHFSEERNPRISDKEVCEVTLRGHGQVVRAKAASPDALAALDRVIAKLEHQIAKLKTRLAKRSHPRPGAAGSVDSRTGRPDDDQRDQDESDDEAGTDRIVKVKRFEIKPMTPEEAALQLDMLGHNFYFFTNADSGLASVVYRRHDGDVGLIEPS